MNQRGILFTTLARARPPLGWWVMLGPMMFRCPACLSVRGDEG